MGVSEFTLTEILPEHLKGSLPTVEEIEADLSDVDEEDLPNNVHFTRAIKKDETGDLP